MSYNPADCKAVEDKAKVMGKPELEEYYVKDRNKRHVSCGEGWGIFFGVIFMLAIVIGIGFAIAESIYMDKIDDNMKDISKEVCPMIGENYVSSEAMHSSYHETRIVCNEFNSVPR